MTKQRDKKKTTETETNEAQPRDEVMEDVSQQSLFHGCVIHTPSVYFHQTQIFHLCVFTACHCHRLHTTLIMHNLLAATFGRCTRIPLMSGVYEC